MYVYMCTYFYVYRERKREGERERERERGTHVGSQPAARSASVHAGFRSCTCRESQVSRAKLPEQHTPHFGLSFSVPLTRH